MNVPIACNPDSGGGRMCRLLPPRVGLTLIEILMTIFVLAIGLLGVAALLPVGTFQMRQGQIAQQSAEVGSRALDTIEASGINHPGRWLAYSSNDSEYFPFDAVVDIDPASNNAEYVRIACPVDTAGTISVATPDADGNGKADLGLTEQEDFYSNCLVEFVRCQWPRASGGTEDVWGKQWRILDGTVNPGGTTTFSNLMFLGTNPPPSSQANDVFVIKRYEPFAIDPLYVADPAHSADPAPAFVPNMPGFMPRLTLSTGLGSPMNLSAAEAVFESTDELQFTPGREGDSESSSEDESKLPEQLAWQSSGSAAKRQSQGEYSWLATFVPVESSTFEDGRTYTVSVAVFYKRPLQLPSSASERTLTLAPDSGSTFTISGTTFENQDPTESPTTFDPDDGDESHIKSGLWGLVTYYDGTVPRARWYRLGSVGKPDNNAGGDVKARLIGPDFPTGATSPQITFYEGLVAVFERTMRVPELPIGEAQ